MRFLLRFLSQLKFHYKCCTDIYLAVNGQLPALFVADAFDGGKSQSETCVLAVVRTIYRKESVKYSWKIFFRNTHAAVGYSKRRFKVFTTCITLSGVLLTVTSSATTEIVILRA